MKKERMKKIMINIGTGALFFAIWLIILFWGKSIGLSMLLFVVPFSCFFIYILEKNNKIKNPKYKFLLIPIILLSSTYAIFDNLFFNIVNILVIPVLCCIMILGLLGQKLETKIEIIGIFFDAFFRPLEYVDKGAKGFLSAIKEKMKIGVKSDGNSETKKKIKKIFLGIIITLPVVLIIIILLSTADAIFAGIFKGAFDIIKNIFNIIDIQIIYFKIACCIMAFCYFIGLFYYMCIKYEIKEKMNDLPLKSNDNFATKMILISLNIIYLVFCYIQIKSLFLRNTTLNYAEYARQGFFQLMAVSIINLVTILIAKKRENKYENKVNKFTNCMCLIMILFTFIIVISAGVRMYFYESTYGYTLLRLLVYCVLIVESILFIPTVLYILDKKVNLTKSYFLIIVVAYICMNFANFNNIIAKRNVDRYIETGEIDLEYLDNATGADSVRQICRLWEITEENNVKWDVEAILEEKYDMIIEENMDFRSFNLSKIIAKNLIDRKR